MTRAEAILEKYATSFIKDPAGSVEKGIRHGAQVGKQAAQAAQGGVQKIANLAQQNPGLAAGGAVALGAGALLARKMRKRKMKQRAGLSSSGGTGIT